MEETVIRNVDEVIDRAEMMRAVNETNQLMVQAQSDVGCVTNLIERLCGQIQMTESQFATAIAELPQRLQSTFEGGRDFYWKAGAGLRFWTAGIAGQRTAEFASAKAMRDMRNVLFDVQQTMEHQFRELLQFSAQTRGMLVTVITRALAPLLSPGPQQNDLLELAQRLLTPSTNGKP